MNRNIFNNNIFLILISLVILSESLFSVIYINHSHDCIEELLYNRINSQPYTQSHNPENHKDYQSCEICQKLVSINSIKSTSLVKNISHIFYMIFISVIFITFNYLLQNITLISLKVKLSN